MGQKNGSERHAVAIPTHVTKQMEGGKLKHAAALELWQDAPVEVSAMISRIARTNFNQ